MTGWRVEGGKNRKSGEIGQHRCCTPMLNERRTQRKDEGPDVYEVCGSNSRLPSFSCAERWVSKGGLERAREGESLEGVEVQHQTTPVLPRTLSHRRRAGLVTTLLAWQMLLLSVERRKKRARGQQPRGVSKKSGKAGSPLRKQKERRNFEVAAPLINPRGTQRNSGTGSLKRHYCRVILRSSSPIFFCILPRRFHAVAVLSTLRYTLGWGTILGQLNSFAFSRCGRCPHARKTPV